MISLDILEEIIKMVTIHLCVYLLFLKISANKEKNIIAVVTSTLGITFVYLLLEYLKFDFSVRLIISALLYSILLAIITKNSIHYSVIVTIISYAITFIFQFIATIIIFILISLIKNDLNGMIIVCLAEILTLIAVFMFLKIKRLDNGMSFLKNNSKLEIFNITIFILSIEIILYVTIVRKPMEEISDADAFSFFVMTSIFMGMLVFMSFRAYYKSLQIKKIIEQQNEDIKAKDEKYDILDAEHERVTKKLHETSHKVKAMAGYLTKVTSMNVEFGGDNGDLLAEIQELQEEMSINSATDDLDKTNVLGIDVMLSYMQNEALKSNIDFELIVSGDIDYMIKNIVDKKALEKMIADHIKDAIISIKLSDDSKNRKILAKIGKFSEKYEFSISDTGIDFEIDTFVNLGLKRITTHSDTGGTGIGFMTTFENLQKCKGSLEIAELRAKEDNIYSKSVSMVFDNKNEYRIFSNRVDEIRLADENKRIILNNN